MFRSLLYYFTASKQYPVGELDNFGTRKLVQLRSGPNEKLLKQMRLQTYARFDWEDIRKTVKQETSPEDYDNFFWDSYMGYKPINRVLYVDATGNYFFKFENEWKLAIRSYDLGHLARQNIDDNPTVHEAFGAVYCFFQDIEAAQI